MDIVESARRLYNRIYYHRVRKLKRKVNVITENLCIVKIETGKFYVYL